MIKRLWAMSKLAVLLVLFMQLGACAQQASSVRQEYPDWLLEDPTFLKPEEQLPLPQNFLTSSEAMKQFVQNLPSAKSRANIRLNGLVKSMRSLNYDPEKNYSAAEIFLKGEGNCLSFANLFVSLARESQLKAYFNEVQLPPKWGNKDEGIFLFYRHINVVVDLGSTRKVIDFGVRDYRSIYLQKVVSDDYAEALFYNNLAIENMQKGNLGLAFLWQRQALQLEPKADFLWNNLGAIYRKSNELEKAEQAYLFSLSIDSDFSLALSNLSRLYRQLNRIEEAEIYERRVRAHRLKNPYYRMVLAQSALEKGNAEEALIQIRRAIRVEPDDPRFYQLAADAHRLLGQQYEENKNTRKANRLLAEAKQKKARLAQRRRSVAIN